MDKNSGSWFVVAAVGVFGVAAVLAYSLVAPTWDQGETSTPVSYTHLTLPTSDLV